MRPQTFRTPITDLLGIRHPILCGGLIWLANADYVAAAVNAGAMGFITALSFPGDPEAFRREVRKCRNLTDERPFGVCLPFSMRPGANDRLRPFVQIVIEERVAFVETSGGSPREFLPQLKDAGCTIIHKAPLVRHALSAQRLGADAVTVVGGEAGGHPGPYLVSTMVQGALAAEQISVPFALAGGMGTGRHLAAALGLGASAMLTGSRMLCADEIWAHSRYKRRVIEATEFDNRVVMRVFRDHHRVFANETAAAVAELESQGIDDFESYRELVSGKLTRSAYTSGDTTHGLIDLGPAATFARKVQPLEEIIDGIIDEAASAVERLAGYQMPAGQAVEA